MPWEIGINRDLHHTGEFFRLLFHKGLATWSFGGDATIQAAASHEDYVSLIVGKLQGHALPAEMARAIFSLNSVRFPEVGGTWSRPWTVQPNRLFHVADA